MTAALFWSRLSGPAQVVALVLFLCIAAVPGNSGSAVAGAVLGAELRLSYEDNVVGLMSDQRRGSGTGSGTAAGTVSAAPGMGGSGSRNRYAGSGSGSSQSPGDFSLSLAADIGGFRNVGGDIDIFAKAFASRTRYETYTDLDATIGGVSAGVYGGITRTISFRTAVTGKLKKFGDGARDASSLGAAISIKEKLTPHLWTKQFVEFERNRADSSAFNYDGTTVGISAGYAVMQDMLATAGYRYLLERYDEPAGGTLKTHTVSLGAERSVGKHWTIAADYDLQTTSESAGGSRTTNNVFSLSLSYTY